MPTVTKREVIDKVADVLGYKRADVQDIIQRFLTEILDELRAGNRLEFRDFGVFEIKERAARVAQNPKTMQKVQVPARRAVRFKVGRLMREYMEDPGQSPVATTEAGAGGRLTNGRTGAEGVPKTSEQPTSITEVKPKAAAKPAAKKRAGRQKTG